MLWNTSDLVGYAIAATDGEVGSIDDFFFDDRTWTIRWAVIDTGSWLSGRKVLLPPSKLGEPDTDERSIPVALTRDQVKNSPDVRTEQPMSRAEENRIYDYYGWEPYWFGWDSYWPGGIIAPSGGPLLTPMAPPVTPPGVPRDDIIPQEPQGDPNLRSTREVARYRIHANDGEIGHVEAFLAEAEGWAIRYMIVDTRNWWPGRKVLVSPRWVKEVAWSDRHVYVDLAREQIRSSPEYDPDRPLAREYEQELHGHYERPGYWADPHLPPRA